MPRLSGWPTPLSQPFLLETSYPGIFAAGDVRLGSIKRVASAVGEGAMAIKFVHEYLAEPRLPSPAAAVGVPQEESMHGADEQARSVTGTVEWYDTERGVGTIRPDDGASPCAVRSEALRECGIEELAAGDRVRFQVREEGGERTASDLARLRAFQRWENEGGAVRPDPAES